MAEKGKSPLGAHPALRGKDGVLAARPCGILGCTPNDRLLLRNSVVLRQVCRGSLRRLKTAAAVSGNSAQDLGSEHARLPMG